METTYKGFNIFYNENSNDWRIRESGDDFPSLAAAKRNIDNITKKDFKRFDVYVNEWRLYYIATVTSITPDNEFWVVKDGKRSKHRAVNVFAVNDSNKDILTEAKAIGAEIERLGEQKRDVLAKLQQVKD